MKTLICFFFIISILVLQPSGQDINSLEGMWKFADNLDCPDVVEFNLCGTYNVLNDCGSLNPKYPVIESGLWKYDSIKNRLVFYKREFISPNSIFSEYHGKSDSLFFKVKILTNNKLTLCFIKDENNECIIEKYNRIQ